MFKSDELIFTVYEHMFKARKHKFTGLKHKKEQKVEKKISIKKKATSLHEVTGRIRYGYEGEFRRSKQLIPARNLPYRP
jgi:hypothetical protein